MISQQKVTRDQKKKKPTTEKKQYRPLTDVQSGLCCCNQHSQSFRGLKLQKFISCSHGLSGGTQQGLRSLSRLLGERLAKEEYVDPGSQDCTQGEYAPALSPEGQTHHVGTNPPKNTDMKTDRLIMTRKMQISSTMDRHRNYHTKWSKSGRTRQMSYDTTYMWNLEK